MACVRSVAAPLLGTLVGDKFGADEIMGVLVVLFRNVLRFSIAFVVEYTYIFF